MMPWGWFRGFFLRMFHSCQGNRDYLGTECSYMHSPREIWRCRICGEKHIFHHQR